MKDHHKMRAWDELTKTYWYLKEDGLFWQEGGNGLNMVAHTIFPKNWPIELCTGLSDKNGTLIYEGDKYKDRRGNISEVDRFEAAYWLIEEDRMNCPTGRIEIIGNIHEVK